MELMTTTFEHNQIDWLLNHAQNYEWLARNSNEPEATTWRRRAANLFERAERLDRGEQEYEVD